MGGFIVLVIFIIVIMNIVRAVLKDMRKKAGTASGPQGDGNNVLSVFSNRGRNEAWMEAAAALNMMYVRPVNLLARPALRGTVKGFIAEAHIEYSSSGCLSTVCSVQFPEKLGLDLLILHDGEDVVAEEFSDRKSLRVTALEGKDVGCSAKNAEVLKRFLTPMRLNSIKNALSFYRVVKITDDYVVLKVPGECRDAEVLGNLIDFTVSLASILYKSDTPEVVPVRGRQDSLMEDDSDLPGLKTVADEAPSSPVSPFFRQPKTVQTPIRPVTDDSDLFEPDDSSGAPAKAETPAPPPHMPRTQKFGQPSRMAEVKPSAAAAPSSSRMPEMKPVAPAAFSPRMPEVKPPAKTVAPPSPPAPFSEFRPASYVKPAEPETGPVSSASLLDQESLAAALFSSSFPGQKEQEIFRSVKGKEIEWTGELKSSYQFGNDFVLGGGPAVKAVFEIAGIAGTYSMKTKVKAVVRLPQEALEPLKNQNGKQFRFSGRLEKFEAFAKEIVILDGALI